MSNAIDTTVNIILAIIILLSLIFNILLIIVLQRKRKQEGWTQIDKIMILIAVVDLLEGSFGIFSATYHTLYGDTLLYDKVWYCQLSSYIITSCLLTSILLLLLISVYRFIILTKKNDRYNKKFLYITIICIIIIHIFGLLCLFFENFSPVGSGAYCYPSFRKGIAGALYYTTIAIFNFTVPLIFGYTYLGIFFTFRKQIHSSKLSSSDNISKIYRDGRQINSVDSMSDDISKKIIFRTLIYLFLYLPIWIPNLISIGWDLANINNPNRPVILDVLSVVGVLLTILVNPIMILLVHSKLLFYLFRMVRIRRN